MMRGEPAQSFTSVCRCEPSVNSGECREGTPVSESITGVSHTIYFVEECVVKPFLTRCAMGFRNAMAPFVKPVNKAS